MSNLNELKPVGSLNPFGRFCCTIGNLPSSYMAALSYEEQLMWFCDYLKNTIIPAVNTNAEAVTELQELYIELKNYVDNYFTNLDVQDEINNKLDGMATDGTLENIINQQIFGKINDDISSINNDINIINNRKFIFFGDSYASGEIGSSWIQNIASYLNLSPNDYYNASNNGYGFTFPSTTNNWISVLQNLINSLTEEERKNYTDILVAGGYNDGVSNTTATFEQITTAIQNFVNLAKLNFPNAKIHIAHIGWTADSSKWKKLRMSINSYKNCTEYGASYINNSEFIMHNYELFDSSYFHPNSVGNEYVAKHLINGLLTGSCDVSYVKVVNLNNFSNNDINFTNLQVVTTTHNELSTFELRNINTNQDTLLIGTGSNTLLNNHVFKRMYNIVNFATCYGGLSDSYNNMITVPALITDTSNVNHSIQLGIVINNYNIAFFPFMDSNYSIKSIKIPPVSFTSNSLYC